LVTGSSDLHLRWRRCVADLVDNTARPRICKVHVKLPRQVLAFELTGGDQMTEQQFSIILFHLRAILGLVGIQASIMLGFAWKYL
jgi:hypothetical protein